MTNSQSLNKLHKDKITLESTDQAYVLSLDILGFGKIVKNNRHQHLMDLFELFVNTYIADVELINKYYLREVENKLTDNLKALFISDTLIIYSLTAEIENFLKIVSLTQMIIANSFELGIPLRGCLTSGILIIKHLENNDILFGKPIVDAYEYEKDQEWSGCCITKKCVETVERFHVNKFKPCLDWLIKNKDIINYKVPLKNSRIEEMMVINWKIAANHIHLNEDTITSAFFMHKKEPINNLEYQKIENMKNNTLAFWNSNIL
jgi:hypothetical protein